MISWAETLIPCLMEMPSQAVLQTFHLLQSQHFCGVCVSYIFNLIKIIPHPNLRLFVLNY